MGRSLLTPERADTIVDAVKAGATVIVAAQAVGIHRSTLLDWMDRGRRERTRHDNLDGGPEPDLELRRREQPYADLSDRVESARACTETEALGVIRDAALGIDETQTVTEDKLVDGVIVTVTRTTVTRKLNWQAAAWLLERRYPSKYGRYTRIEAEQPDEDGIVTEPIEEVRERAVRMIEDELKPLRAMRAAYNNGGDG